MKAKFIYEKFEEESDPIKDMGIGGIKLIDEHKRIEDDAVDRWITFLKDNLEGKIVNGTMMRWDSRHQWKKYTFRVKKVMNTKEKMGLL